MRRSRLDRSGAVPLGSSASARSKNSRWVTTSSVRTERSVSPWRTITVGVVTFNACPASRTPRGMMSRAAARAARRSMRRVGPSARASTCAGVATTPASRSASSTARRFPAAAAVSTLSKNSTSRASMVSAASATKLKVGGTDSMARSRSLASSSTVFGTLKGMRAMTSSVATIPSS